MKNTKPDLAMTDQMFVCLETPPVPGSEDTDAVLATYIVRLVMAHDDCKSQLDTVKNHLELNGVQVGKQVFLEEDADTKFLGVF